MERRTACFVCTTPYQIMGAIAIVQDKQMDADLYFYGTFNRYEDVAEKLSKAHVFNKVIAIDFSPYVDIGKLRTLWQVVNSKKIVSSVIPPDIIYDSIYSSNRAHTNLLLIYELSRRNPRMKYIYFEDGVGTYGDKISILKKRTRGHNLIEIFKRCNSINPSKTSIMVTHPELLNVSSIPFKILPMPFLHYSLSMSKLLREVFSVYDSDILNKRVVFFDTVRDKYSFKDPIIIKMDECLNLFVSVFSKSDIVYKSHPRSSVVLSDDMGFKTDLSTSVPVEVFYYEMTELNNRILVGNLSTALFTPKLMFDKEPIVISLHRIVIPKDTKCLSFFEKMRLMYKDKNRIVAPANMEELKFYLKNYHI